MQYQVELLKIDQLLSHELKFDYEMKADQRLEELKANDICNAKYQAIDNAYGYKVILKSGQIYEELIPSVTSNNTLEIIYDCAFGSPVEIPNKPTDNIKKKRKKPRNNTNEELTYFNERDLNGRYIAIGLRAKNPIWKGKGYNKYNTLHVNAQIDLEDLEYFQEHRMRLNNDRLVINSPYQKGNAYVSRAIMARILTGDYDDRKLPKGLVVDHKDRNPLNNREFNLRLVTPMENALNTRSVDLKIENDLFYGLGIKKIGDYYEIKAYQLTGNGTYHIADTKNFKDLDTGKAWKNSLESELYNDYLKKTIEIQVA